MRAWELGLLDCLWVEFVGGAGQGSDQMVLMMMMTYVKDGSTYDILGGRLDLIEVICFLWLVLWLRMYLSAQRGVFGGVGVEIRFEFYNICYLLDVTTWNDNSDSITNNSGPRAFLPLSLLEGINQIVTARSGMLHSSEQSSLNHNASIFAHTIVSHSQNNSQLQMQ